MDFNPKPPDVMHVDLNSCFATVEQQANPRLRGKPVAVAAYVESRGCILAASVEAKRLGIKTGMRVGEGRSIYPGLIVLAPDPDKYRFINRELLALLSSYSADIHVESIDEMVVSFAETPSLGRFLKESPSVEEAMLGIAREIKMRIKREIGDWLTVSIGIAPNRYLAKIASGLHKPDGLDVISKDTIENIFATLSLEDLCGIKDGNGNRLRCAGITTPLQMCHTSASDLARAFHSINGSHWWSRLHGYEDGSMYKAFGSPEDEQKTFGQSYAFGKSYAPQDNKIHQIMAQLVLKMGRRLREAGCTAHGVGVSTLFTDFSHWGKREMHVSPLFSDGDFYQRMKSLLIQAPARPVRILAVYTYRLERTLYTQQSLLEEDTKKTELTKALDAVSNRWGEFIVTPARMLNMDDQVLDRIAFGKVRGLTGIVSH